MPISMFDPLDQAFRRTKWILFQPFDLAKWFILGFCAWLAYLGEGYANFNFNAPGNFGNNGSGGPDLLLPKLPGALKLKFAPPSPRWASQAQNPRMNHLARSKG